MRALLVLQRRAGEPCRSSEYLSEVYGDRGMNRWLPFSFIAVAGLIVDQASKLYIDGSMRR